MVEHRHAGHRTRRLLVSLLLVTAALALALWLLFPWGPIHGLAVDGSGYVGRRAADSVRRVAVVFSTPEPLETVRRRKNAGFITAALSVCDDTARSTSEVVTQRAGYLPNEGRVTTLPPAAAAGRSRYRALFDDPRTEAERGRSIIAPPLAELCLSLSGGSMWAGKLWSESVRLAPADHR